MRVPVFGQGVGPRGGRDPQPCGMRAKSADRRLKLRGPLVDAGVRPFQVALPAPVGNPGIPEPRTPNDECWSLPRPAPGTTEHLLIHVDLRQVEPECDSSARLCCARHAVPTRLNGKPFANCAPDSRQARITLRRVPKRSRAHDTEFSPDSSNAVRKTDGGAHSRRGGGPVTDVQQGADWWLASDGKWYPPERHPDFRPPGPGSGIVPPRPNEQAGQQSGYPPATAADTPRGTAARQCDRLCGTAVRRAAPSQLSSPEMGSPIRNSSPESRGRTAYSAARTAERLSNSRPRRRRNTHSGPLPAVRLSGTAVRTAAGTTRATRLPAVPRAAGLTRIGSFPLFPTDPPHGPSPTSPPRGGSAPNASSAGSDRHHPSGRLNELHTVTYRGGWPGLFGGRTSKGARSGRYRRSMGTGSGSWRSCGTASASGSVSASYCCSS